MFTLTKLAVWAELLFTIRAVVGIYVAGFTIIGLNISLVLCMCYCSCQNVGDAETFRNKVEMLHKYCEFLKERIKQGFHLHVILYKKLNLFHFHTDLYCDNMQKSARCENEMHRLPKGLTTHNSKS